MEQVSHRYAKALFELAAELKVTDLWQDQMRFVKDVFESDKEFIKVLGHYRINKENKKEMLSNVFKDKIDKNLLNFLLLLVDKKRIGNVVSIATSFNILCNESKNIQEGIVYSINKLSKEEINDVEKAVGEKLSLKIELTNKLDEALISGIKVVVGDVVFDGSMRHRLDSLRSELYKGK